LLSAHQFAFSAEISYQNRISGVRFEPQSKSINERLGVIAQFIQGTDLTETAITEGLYPQAANLLKQELESISVIDEHEEGTRIDGRVPRFRGPISAFGTRHGELNDIAHPTRQDVIERLNTFADGERYGPTSVPQFNAEIWKLMYGTQATFLIMLLGRMRVPRRYPLSLRMRFWLRRLRRISARAAQTWPSRVARAARPCVIGLELPLGGLVALRLR